MRHLRTFPSLARPNLDYLVDQEVSRTAVDAPRVAADAPEVDEHRLMALGHHQSVRRRKRRIGHPHDDCRIVAGEERALSIVADVDTVHVGRGMATEQKSSDDYQLESAHIPIGAA